MHQLSNRNHNLILFFLHTNSSRTSATSPPSPRVTSSLWLHPPRTWCLMMTSSPTATAPQPCESNPFSKLHLLYLFLLMHLTDLEGHQNFCIWLGKIRHIFFSPFPLDWEGKLTWKANVWQQIRDSTTLSSVGLSFSVRFSFSVSVRSHSDFFVLTHQSQVRGRVDHESCECLRVVQHELYWCMQTCHERCSREYSFVFNTTLEIWCVLENSFTVSFGIL